MEDVEKNKMTIKNTIIVLVLGLTLNSFFVSSVHAATVVCYRFPTNMRLGSRGDAVKNLHTLLQKESLGVQVPTGTLFTSKTLIAVKRFQEKYSAILRRVELTKGTGFVGPSTRQELNTNPRFCSALTTSEAAALSMVNSSLFILRDSSEEYNHSGSTIIIEGSTTTEIAVHGGPTAQASSSIATSTNTTTTQSGSNSSTTSTLPTQTPTVPEPEVLPPPPATPAFLAGQKVETTQQVNVRLSPNGTIIGTQQTSALGTVLGGPVRNGGAEWFNVNFQSGADGWVIKNYLVSSNRAFSAPSIAIITPTSNAVLLSPAVVRYVVEGDAAQVKKVKISIGGSEYYDDPPDEEFITPPLAQTIYTLSIVGLGSSNQELTEVKSVSFMVGTPGH